MKSKSTPKSCLIVCDGTFNKQLLSVFLKEHIPLISADGASNTLYKFKISPQYIIGDMDSIEADAFEHYLKSGVEIRQLREQEHNDFEKSVMFALSMGFKKMFVIGFAGKRVDHTLNNFSILKKYYQKTDIRFIDSRFEIFFIRKVIEFEYKKGEMLSLQGIPYADGISTHGLRYPLDNGKLEFGKREGALNEAIGKHIKIEYKRGSLLLFKKHFGKFFAS
jgi:thiamine pyrophosphokinase